MKKSITLLVSSLFILSIHAQSWKDLSQEQKQLKAKDFRADNQKYLKETLGLSRTQIDDIDNVNVCYISTLDRIDRYGKTDDAKGKFAEAVTAARSAQLDAIMGEDKRKQFQDYVLGKLKKAGLVE